MKHVCISVWAFNSGLKKAKALQENGDVVMLHTSPVKQHLNTKCDDFIIEPHAKRPREAN